MYYQSIVFQRTNMEDSFMFFLVGCDDIMPRVTSNLKCILQRRCFKQQRWGICKYSVMLTPLVAEQSQFISLILTILNSNKATNSSELLKTGGNALTINSFPMPAILPHPEHLQFPFSLLPFRRRVTAFSNLDAEYSSSTFDLQAKIQQIIKIFQFI